MIPLDVLRRPERKTFLDEEIEEEFWLEVGRRLVKAGIISEIIVSSREEFEKYSKYYGFIHYHALREGVMIA